MSALAASPTVAMTRAPAATASWTAAEPNLRWISRQASGLRASVEDVSEQVAALALQGPTSAALLRAAADVDVDSLR